MSDDFFRRVITELEPIMGRSIVPMLVYDAQNETACVYATGTLFQIADHHFLITAAHVAAGAKKDFGNRLFTSDAQEKSDFVPLDGCCVHSYTHNALDVAIFELTDTVLAAIPHRTFLNLSNVDFSADSPKGFYYIYGWPCELSREDESKKLVAAEQFQFITQIYPGDSPEGIAYDSQIHLLLALPHETGGSTRLLDSEVARPHKLQGISGCSIWKVCDSAEQTEGWSSTDARIIAVQSTAIRQDQSIIKGVRWHTVAAVMWHAYPELQRSMMVTHPQMARIITYSVNNIRKYLND